MFMYCSEADFSIKVWWKWYIFFVDRWFTVTARTKQFYDYSHTYTCHFQNHHVDIIKTCCFIIPLMQKRQVNKVFLQTFKQCYRKWHKSCVLQGCGCMCMRVMLDTICQMKMHWKQLAKEVGGTNKWTCFLFASLLNKYEKSQWLGKQNQNKIVWSSLCQFDKIFQHLEYLLNII